MLLIYVSLVLGASADVLVHYNEAGTDQFLCVHTDINVKLSKLWDNGFTEVVYDSVRKNTLSSIRQSQNATTTCVKFLPPLCSYINNCQSNATFILESDNYVSSLKFVSADLYYRVNPLNVYYARNQQIQLEYSLPALAPNTVIIVIFIQTNLLTYKIIASFKSGYELPPYKISQTQNGFVNILTIDAITFQSAGTYIFYNNTDNSLDSIYMGSVYDYHPENVLDKFVLTPVAYSPIYEDSVVVKNGAKHITACVQFLLLILMVRW